MDIRENEPLAAFTSFHIGGTARFFCEARTAEDVVDAVGWAKSKSVPLFILGGGTNILMGDGGFPGLVVKLDLRDMEIVHETIRAGSGVPWMTLLEKAAEASLAGLEWGAGIPGTVGGALRGNAGAYGHSIGEYVENVQAISSADGVAKIFAREECAFSYRSSFFKLHPEYIITETVVRLTPGDRKTLEAKMAEIVAIRNGKLPSEPSAGSVFKNIELARTSAEEILACITDASDAEREQWKAYGKIPAGWLIEHCGLKGKKIGGAQISEKHANTIINTGNATAEDVIMLTSLIKQKVRDTYGIQLEEEVEFVSKQA